MVFPLRPASQQEGIGAAAIEEGEHQDYNFDGLRAQCFYTTQEQVPTLWQESVIRTKVTQRLCLMPRCRHPGAVQQGNLSVPASGQASEAVLKRGYRNS